MNKPSIPCYCKEQSNCEQRIASLHSLQLSGYGTHDVLGGNTNTGVERRRRLTRRGYARHPLFGFAGKRGLKFHYFSFFNTMLSTVQAPLSTAGEERVAGAASPGESSPQCNLLHPHFKSSRNPNACNNLGTNTIYPI